MALIKMRESISLSSSTYESRILTNDSPEMKQLKESSFYGRFFNGPATLREKNNEVAYNELKTLSHLFEDKSDSQRIFLSALDKIKETTTKEVKLWKLPVARFGNVNKNKRVYSRQLWENVINNQSDVWKGGVGLADHPERDDDPGEMKYAAIVWLDMIIDDTNKLIWGIGVFVGQLGRLFQEIIEAGGRLGFSSSGFGESMPDKVTVNPDTYSIERVADIVINPSQSVYGDITEKDSAKKAVNIEFSSKKVPEFQGDEIHTSNIDFKFKENTKENKIMSSIVNAVGGKDKIKENGQVQAPQPAAAQPTAPAATPAPAPQAAAAPAQSAPVAPPAPQAPVATPKKESIEQNNALLMAKYAEDFLNKGINDIDSPTLRLSELRELQQNLFNPLINPGLRESVDKRIEEEEKNLQKLVEDASSLKKDLAAEDLEKFKEDAKKLAEEAVLLKEENTDYVKLAEGLVERNKNLSKEVTGLKVRLKLKEKADKSVQRKLNESLVGSTTQVDALVEEMKEDKRKIKVLSERVKIRSGNETKLKEQVEELESTNKKLSESNKNLEKKTGFSTTRLAEAEGSLKARKDQVARLQEKVIQLETELKNTNKEFQSFKEQVEFDSDPSNHMEKPFSKRVDKYVNLREGKGVPVENYWEALLERYGESILPFENGIRKAKTYREASHYFLKHKDEIDSLMREANDTYIPPQINSRKMRESLLEDSGFTRDVSNVDQVNKSFIEQANKFGFK